MLAKSLWCATALIIFAYQYRLAAADPVGNVSIQLIGTMEASDAAPAIDMCWPLWRKDAAHTIAPIVIGTRLQIARVTAASVSPVYSPMVGAIHRPIDFGGVLAPGDLQLLDQLQEHC